MGPVKGTVNDLPRDFHLVKRDGKQAQQRASRNLMEALVLSSPFLFARKMGKSDGKLVFDLNKEAFENAGKNLPAMWMEADEKHGDHASNFRGPEVLDTGNPIVLKQMSNWKKAPSWWTVLKSKLSLSSN